MFLFFLLFSLSYSGTFFYSPPIGISYWVTDINDNEIAIGRYRYVDSFDFFDQAYDSDDDDVFLEIPEIINNKTVVKIFPNSFEKSNIEFLRVPKTLKYIGDNAFANTQLRSVILKNTRVSFIGDFAFFKCSEIIYFTVSRDLTHIGKSALKGCTSITELNFPESLEFIGDSSFHSMNSITVFNLSKTRVRVIPPNCFRYCTHAKKLLIPSCTERIEQSAFINLLSINKLEFPSSLLFIGYRAFANSGLKVVDLSNTSVTKLDKECFMNCNELSTLSLPSTINYIGERAFVENRILSSITIRGGLSFVGYSCFQKCTSISKIDLEETDLNTFESCLFLCCTSMTTIKLPKVLISIKTKVFYNCTSLNNIVFYAALKTIEKYAFFHCTNLNVINLTDTGVTELPENVFSHSGIQKLFMSRVEKIGRSALAETKKLDTIKFSSKLSVIEDHAFDGSSALKELDLGNTKLSCFTEYCFANMGSLTTIKLPNTLKKLMNRCIYMDSSIKTIDFSKTQVTEFPTELFYCCENLESVVFPDNLQKIGERCFFKCSNIRSLNLTKTNFTKMPNELFACIGKVPTVYYPNTMKEFGTNYFINSSFREINLRKLNVPVTKLSDGFCQNCAELLIIKLPSSIKELGNRCFAGCTLLTSIDFKQLRATSFPRECFSGCTKLKKIEISKNVTVFAARCFFDCGFTSFEALPHIKQYGEECFGSCMSLKTAHFNNSMISFIPNFMFANCKSLEEIFFPETITDIGEFILANTSVKVLVLPSSTRTLSDFAFADMTMLKDVDLGATQISAVSDFCFMNDLLISNLVVKDESIYIPENAFDKSKREAFGFKSNG